MKKVLLCVVLFIFVSITGLVALTWYDVEPNNTMGTAQQNIDPGTNAIAYWDGAINYEGDVDWFAFPLNGGDVCRISFISHDSQNTSCEFYSDNPPNTVEGTATPSFVFTSNPVAAGDGLYYARVSGTAGSYPAAYYLKLENLTSETFLPVTLSTFTAIYNNDGVGITWTTQTETNLAGYNLIRSETTNMTEGINVNGAKIIAHNTSTVKTYNFKDDEIEGAGAYYYWLEVVEIDGGIDYHGPVQVDIIEDEEGEETPDVVYHTGIISSYPNPFSSNIDIQVEMGKSANTEISVYNIKGEKINVIQTGELGVGTHTFNWNGRDVHGKTVSNGIYFFRLNSHEGTFTHKVTYIK